jgi:hypothetical protein
LALRSNEDLSLAAPVCVLVVVRAVDPNGTGPIDVARSHLHDFIRSHAGVPLQPDHCRDNVRQVRQDDFDF